MPSSVNASNNCLLATPSVRKSLNRSPYVSILAWYLYSRPSLEWNHNQLQHLLYAHGSVDSLQSVVLMCDHNVIPCNLYVSQLIIKSSATIIHKCLVPLLSAWLQSWTQLLQVASCSYRTLDFHLSMWHIAFRGLNICLWSHPICISVGLHC